MVYYKKPSYIDIYHNMLRYTGISGCMQSFGGIKSGHEEEGTASDDFEKPGAYLNRITGLNIK